jgi:alanine racemase
MPSRRRFLSGSAAFALAAHLSPRAAALASPIGDTGVGPLPGTSPARTAAPGDTGGYDPWLEIDGEAFRHNAREVARLGGGRPIMAVVKNNAYGLGDTVVGPLLSSCPEVGAIACVRPVEALAHRGAGVKKPILVMAEIGEDEAVELAAHDVTMTCWLDDSGARMERVARRAGKPVGVHLFIDTGMNREGMPHGRALPWIADLAGRKAVRIDGTYHMFVHQLEFDRIQHERFVALTRESADRGLKLGTLHAAPSFELFHLPEAHHDMVRVGNALFGNYPGPDVRDRASLKPVVSLKARVTRVEQIQPGDSAGFRRGFMPDRATWIALLPVGHTDGYPITAAGTCQVLIGGRLYPVAAGAVASAHTIVDLGPEKTVNVGDTATLVGGEDPAIDPVTVGTNAKVGFLGLISKFQPRLPRRLV